MNLKADFNVSEICRRKRQDGREKEESDQIEENLNQRPIHNRSKRTKGWRRRKTNRERERRESKAMAEKRGSKGTGEIIQGHNQNALADLQGRGGKKDTQFPEEQGRGEKLGNRWLRAAGVFSSPCYCKCV